MSNRTIGSDASNAAFMMNHRVMGAQEAASELRINPSLVDQALNKYGTDLVKALGPDYIQYLRMMGSSLNVLCDRMGEAEIKALPSSPPKIENVRQEWFMARDTSQSEAWEGHIPAEMLTHPEAIPQMAARGWFSPEVAGALQRLVHLPTPGSTSHQNENPTRAAGQAHHEAAVIHTENWAHFDQNPAEQVRTGHFAYTAGPEVGGANQAPLPPGAQPNPTTGYHPGGANPGAGYLPPTPQGSVTTPTTGAGSVSGGGLSQDIGVVSHSDPMWGNFQTLFSAGDQFRSTTTSILGKMAKRKELKNQIMAELAGLDPTKPENMNKIRVLNQQLSDASGDDQTDMMALQEAQRAYNQVIEMMSKMFDIYFDTQKKIVSNMGGR